jgi:hypothetical protein
MKGMSAIPTITPLTQKLGRCFPETPLFRDGHESAQLGKLSAPHCVFLRASTASAPCNRYQASTPYRQYRAD